jgi:hypothetical protein
MEDIRTPSPEACNGVVVSLDQASTAFIEEGVAQFEGRTIRVKADMKIIGKTDVGEYIVEFTGLQTKRHLSKTVSRGVEIVEAGALASGVAMIGQGLFKFFTGDKASALQELGVGVAAIITPVFNGIVNLFKKSDA